MAQRQFTVYNSRSQQLEQYQPKDNNVKWYVCGPTVYDDAHLGHARTYMMNDMLVKIMKQYDYDVKVLMNITDVDDKILKRSLETFGEEKRFMELGDKYTQRFLEDMIDLNIELPDHIHKVSDHIDDMIKFISKLVDNNYAYPDLGDYPDKGKSIYFDTGNYNTKYNSNIFNKAKDQGDFEDKHLKDKKAGPDFALWKGVKDNEVGWSSPWGRGRPGWHTECATLIDLYYKDELSIHTGGVDLCFPHHENELKQIVATYSHELNNTYFMHIGHLHIRGQKMAKSLKNFTTIRSFLGDDNKSKKSKELRYMFLMHHYREPMDFSMEHFQQAQRQLHLLYNFMETLKLSIKAKKNDLNYDDNHDTSSCENMEHTGILLSQLKIKVNTLLLNDFQIHLVLKELNEFTDHMHGMLDIQTTLSYPLNMFEHILKYYEKILELFGLSMVINDNCNDEIYIDMISKIRDVIRDQAKITKNKELWKLSDVIRNDMLKPMGYQLEDKSDGPTVWKRI
jgi:cysteinyl-tRNA synthetase